MAPFSNKSKHTTLQLLFLPVFSGMLASQIIGTLFVYLSNQRVLAAAEAIEKAGYFPIPGGQAMASLSSFTPALWGGLFFTLSTGIALTLVSWSAIRLWDLCFNRNLTVLRGYIVLWIGLTIYANIQGPTLFPTLFCLLVPPVAAWVTRTGCRTAAGDKTVWWFVPAVTLVLLTALWATQMNSRLFITIRDHILLSNPVGRTVNDFYYRNTLYAAEAFKTFNQKTLRTCRLEGFSDNQETRQLATRLAKNDVLAVPDLNRPDVRMVVSDGVLRLNGSNTRIETTVNALLADPKQRLTDFSQAEDRYGPFRKITLAGLLIGFPIFLFVMVYGLLRIILAAVTGEDKSVLTASALCLAIGALLFLPMLSARPMQITKNNLDQALESRQWPIRVAALRYLEAHNMEVARYPAYRELLSSPKVVERYWLARVLAKSRAPSTYPLLLALLKDPHPNVICQVFYALGERRRPAAIVPIKKKMTTLDHWYAQWYGYRALRKLGWYQQKSD